MEDIYLFDSPTLAKLKALKKDYDNLNIIDVLLYLEIHKSYCLMKDKYDSLLQKYDLTEAKFSIMMLLTYEKDMTLAPSDLAEKLGSKKSTITGIIKGMEKRNLIRRKVLPNDKRTNYVQLTTEGSKLLKRFLPFNYDLVSKVFEVFSEEEKEQFYMLSNKLKNHLEKDELL
ncbi:MarR family transcriptional regulator [Staphylococcus succinus]|nr:MULTISPECIES: MarR family transcriptional regulator [Staphylococcus]MDH9162439.1 MarR family transcriptional regulator [Staphylococcus succinus]MEB8124479.1 MarR family transcriptional regulator [Staphylococcus succinus]OIJ30661.1 MarR family transcriptional regulator [Staphylococcus sp. LCT-H4]